MTEWLRRMLGHYRPKPNPELEVQAVRSDAALTKAANALKREGAVQEARRIEQLRGSFRRADQRLGG